MSSTQQLQMAGLPVIQTVRDFALLSHVTEASIYQYSRNADRFYKTYEIPKKTGGLRTIAQPNRQMKGLQAWILVNILNRLRVSESCKGFERKSSIADNAQPHVGANIVITMDLENFFPSVPSRRVYSVFRSAGYNSTISAILTKLCTFAGGLPQGAPTSPRLANLVLWRLDSRIQGYVGRRGITYTRYADDLSFSGLYPHKVCKIVRTVKLIIREEGFSLNTRKFRVAGTSSRKRVTGLIVGEESVGIGVKKYRSLRAKIHGFINAPPNTQRLWHIAGWLAFVKGVDAFRYRRLMHYIGQLEKKYPENPALFALRATQSSSQSKNASNNY